MYSRRIIGFDLSWSWSCANFGLLILVFFQNFLVRKSQISLFHVQVFHKHWAKVIRNPTCELWWQVHPYTYRNENQFLHFNFHQDPYAEYDYWINKIGVDGLFTDFTGSLYNFQEWTSPLSQDDGDDDGNAAKLLHKIATLVSPYRKGWLCKMQLLKTVA